MKKTISVLVFVTIILCVFAGCSPKKLYLSEVVNIYSTGVELHERIYYDQNLRISRRDTYNEKDELTKTILIKYDKSGYMIYHETVMHSSSMRIVENITNDSNGRAIRTETTQYFKQGTTESFVNEFSYDDVNNSITVVITMGVTGAVNTRTEYYDAHGNIDKIDRDGKIENFKNTYDGNNLIKRETSSSILEFTYDDDLLIETRTYNITTGVLVLTERNVYSENASVIQ